MKKIQTSNELIPILEANGFQVHKGNKIYATGLESIYTEMDCGYLDFYYNSDKKIIAMGYSLRSLKGVTVNGFIEFYKGETEIKISIGEDGIAVERVDPFHSLLRER